MHAAAARAASERAVHFEHVLRRRKQCRLLQAPRIGIARRLTFDSHLAHGQRDEPGHQAGGQRERHDRAADGHFALSARNGLQDSLRHHFRLIDGPRRSRGPTHMARGVAEIGCVRGRRKYGGDRDGAALEFQFALHRLPERAHRRFGSRIGRHQRQAVKRDGRAHIDDAAPAPRPHVRQRHARAVDRAVIGDVRHALEFPLRHVAEAAIDAVAGTIDPHIDGAEIGHDGIRGRDESFAVRDVGLRGGRQRAGAFHIASRRREAFGAACDQAHAPAVAREQPGGASPDAGRAPCDDDDAQIPIAQR